LNTNPLYCLKLRALKTSFLLLLPLFYLTNCFGQDTVEQKNRLPNNVIERFYVLKSDQKTKQGPYKAFLRRRTLIAMGNYKNNKRTGIWTFYESDGRLVERFNYDNNTFLNEAPLDTAGDISYLFDAKIKESDRLTRPLKIGGSYYGFLPYVTLFRLPFSVMDVNTNSFKAYIELLISPGGRLADYKVHLASALYEYKQIINMDVSLFSEEDRQFLPATLNDEPILSRIIIKCYVTPYGDLDFL
jgi:hypothetical protein